MDEDLRLVELEKREGMQLGPVAGIMTVVVAGILLTIAVFVNSKVNDAVGIPTNYSANSTVCPTCVGWTSDEVTTFNSVSSNTLDALDIQSVGLIVLGVAGLVGVLYILLR